MFKNIKEKFSAQQAKYEEIKANKKATEDTKQLVVVLNNNFEIALNKRDGEDLVRWLNSAKHTLTNGAIFELGFYQAGDVHLSYHSVSFYYWKQATQSTNEEAGSHE
ncbi:MULTISPECIES: hypothetical protein [Bacillus]|uniref:hypothetical protein n=1 Tax=Bacillus TaxID=1386 RepID=UPI0011A2254F|nr:MULTISPECIES: hypothetical protein [Bacillus]MDX9635992.1 hypothetical protein [Bacillus sp. PBL-C9]